MFSFIVANLNLFLNEELNYLDRKILMQIYLLLS